MEAFVAAAGSDYTSSVHQLHARERMIEDQIAARGVRDPAVLDAIRSVPRELFVPDGAIHEAYEDRALPIGPAQTISQPFIVAYMTERLAIRPHQVVLEVGTGSGYQAAVLSRLAARVHTIEQAAHLSEAAQRRLRHLGITNVSFHVGDGSLGLPEHAPYDRIMVTAACPRPPQPLVDQLRLGGLLEAPVGTVDMQSLVLVGRRDSGTVETPLIKCRFVKLVGAAGWPVGE